MNNENTLKMNQEIELLKTYLPDYLSRTTYYNPKRPRANILCILGHESRPSMSFNRKNNTLHCFSCGSTFSIIDLVIMDYRIGDESQPLRERLKDKTNIAKAIQKIKEIYNISGNTKAYDSKENYQPRAIDLKAILNNDNTLDILHSKTFKEYATERGLYPRILAIADVKYNHKQEEIIIPYKTSSSTDKRELETLTIRSIKKDIEKENRYKHLGKTDLYDIFNILNRTNKRVMFLTEGEIDSLSIYSVLIEKDINHLQRGEIGSIALGGINNQASLYKTLDVINRDNLYIILALDNDSRGELGSKQIENYLFNHNINYATDFIPYEYKDINEYLVANKDELFNKIIDTYNNIDRLCNESRASYQAILDQEIKRAREQYTSSNSVSGYINTFKEHFNNPIRPVETHFKNLDNYLNGGIREGLITIGAISSLGKTSFILQLADQIAESRQADILYYSLEMSIDELIAKSISRNMYLLSNSNTELVKTQAEILNASRLWSDKEKELYNNSLNSYLSYSNNIYIKEGVYNLGVKEIKEEALKHKEITNKAPIIIIDYLQILATPDVRLTDKQKTDENILQLKQLSRDLKTPIIVVSSLNRSSYNIDVSLESFKESGAIEYTSDLILGLNYRLNDSQEAELQDLRREIKGDLESIKEQKLSDFFKKVRSSSPRYIKLDILKNRNGLANVSVDFQFYPNFNFFIETKERNINQYRDLLAYSIQEMKKKEDEELPF